MLFNILILFSLYSLHTCFIKKYTINSVIKQRLPSTNKVLFNTHCVIDFPEERNSVTKDILDFKDGETFYTLIWYKCRACEELLRDVKDAKIKILYIDGSYYFFDDDELTNNPLLYRNDELVATDVFEIYSELFS